MRLKRQLRVAHTFACRSHVGEALFTSAKWTELPSDLPNRGNRKRFGRSIALLITSFALVLAFNARGTPYASKCVNSSGTVSFVLNEDADSVTVYKYPSGASTTTGTGKGPQSFSLGIDTSYEIVVKKVSANGYATPTVAARKISNDTDIRNKFYSPRGVAVNRDPNSAYFGRVYISHPSVGTTASPARSCTRGIYINDADGTDVLGQGDTAKTGGITFDASTSSPWRIAVGQDNNLYICDWSDAKGNLYRTGPDVGDSGFEYVLKALNTHDASIPVGSANNHGSVTAVVAEGSTATGDLTIYTIDEDLQTSRTTSTVSQMNSLWRYPINAGSLPFGSFNANYKLWTASGTEGYALASQTLDLVRGANGYFYITTWRGTAQSGLIVRDAAGTTTLFNIFDASDGNSTQYYANGVAVTSDQKYVATCNGPGASGNAGTIRIYPLDNGVPVWADRKSITAFSGTSPAAPRPRAIDFDAAGNIYVVDNYYELLRIYSPGGTTIAVTGNNDSGTAGTFRLVSDSSTWNGRGTDDNWSNGANWDTYAPNSGSALQISFAGSNRTSPNMEDDYTAAGLTFESSAASFTLDATPGATLTLSGDITQNSVNQQTIDIPVSIAASRTVNTVNGNLAMNGVLTGSGGIAKMGTGTLALGGDNTYEGTTTVSAGTMQVNGSIGNGAVSVESGATLGGGGAIGGAVTVEDGGTLAPGASIGTLTLGASPSLGGTLAMEIDKAGDGTRTADKLALGANDIEFGGALTVTKTGAGTLADGDSFTLIETTGSKSGWFTSVTLPALAAGLSWDTNNLASSGVLDVYSFSSTPLAVSTTEGTAATLAASKLASHVNSGKAASPYPTGWSAAVTTAAKSGSSVVVNVDGTVTYTPGATANADGSDSFTLTLQDGHGTRTLAVSVTVNAVNAGPTLTPVNDEGHYKITTSGMPDLTYDVQAITDGTGGWQKLDEVTAESNGVVSWTDPDLITDHTSRIYRLAQH